MEVLESWQEVQDKILYHCERARRSPDDLSLLAISKKQPVEKTLKLIDKGQRAFGENYVQEALQKQESLAKLSDEPVSWHFVGKLQKNKLRKVIGRFSLIHSLDSWEIAEKMNQVCRDMGVVQPCLLQVNIAHESTKSGASPEESVDLAIKIAGFENVDLQGIMVFPPFEENQEKQKAYFQEGVEIYNRIGDKLLNESDRLKKSWRHLSMGTSHDYGAAIESGATIIRLGRILFGERD